MPKIILKNGDTGKLEEFEPIDAREVLSSANTIYTVPTATKEGIGLQLDAGVVGGENGLNVAQLQGGDAEMQTGLSVEKYARQAVVKAQPGDPAPRTSGVETSDRPMSTRGQPLTGTAPSADGMTVAELKGALDEKGIAYPTGAHKADLQALYEQANA